MPVPLEQLAPDLWVATRPLKLWIGDIGSRMTVIRMASGDLMLHSPVELDDPTKKAVTELGTVRWLVGPCLVHHFYLPQWQAAFPEAALCGAPGLAEKRKDLPFSVRLPEEAPGSWDDVLRLELIGGAPFMNEVVFLHAPSRTLILTDLAFNRPAGTPDGAALFHRLVGARNHFGPHRIIRFGMRDRAAGRRSIDRILEWDFDRIVVSHGAVLESGGKNAFREAFAYLRRTTAASR